MTIWNERYGTGEFLFGKEPNRFFKETIDGLEPGKLLLPGEGEGRNAVYAARLGWDVYAFDASEVGRSKALLLAEDADVSINYDVSLVEHYEAEPAKYDAIALIYCHLNPKIRKPFFQKLAESLAPGGTLFMEAFHKEQLVFSSGGPKDPDLLYSVEQLAVEFASLPDLEITQQAVWLDEGPGHQGEARVVRLVARHH